SAPPLHLLSCPTRRSSDLAAFLQHFSWSFPSGHAMGSLIGYGMLAYVLTLLWIHRRSAQIAVVLGTAVVIAAIGISRLYLGVHRSEEHTSELQSRVELLCR